MAGPKLTPDDLDIEGIVDALKDMPCDFSDGDVFEDDEAIEPADSAPLPS